MLSFSFSLKSARWYHWLLAACGCLYITYIALSYLYLPGKLKKISETDLAGMIGRDVTVAEFKFNPFALSLTIDGFILTDRPGKPLVAWQRLYVNFELVKSLFNWGITLDEFELDRPEMNIERHLDRFNFSDILSRFETEKEPEESEPKEKIQVAFAVSYTAIRNGIFQFRDSSGSKPAVSNFDNVTIEVENIYLATGNEELNPFDIKAKIPGGGDLRLNGNFRLDPLHVEAEIIADGVRLANFSEFVENTVPIKISNGRMSFSTRLWAEQTDHFQLQMDRGRVEITSLALDDGASDPPMLRANSIAVDSISLDVFQKKATAKSVSLSGIRSVQWIDPEGRFRYEGLIPKRTGEAPVTADGSQKNAATWDLTVQQITLDNSMLTFSDQNPVIKRDHSLTEIAITLGNFTLTPNHRIHLAVSSLLDEKGRVQADGTVMLSPLFIDLDYHLENIQLSPFSEYMEAISCLRINNGNLSMDGNISMTSTERDITTAVLNLSLNDVEATDTRTGEALLNMDAFNMDRLQFNTDTRTVAIESVVLLKPEVFAKISPDKEMNLATVFESDENAKSSSPSSGKEEVNMEHPWQFYIQKTRIKEGAAHFTDSSVSPSFTTGIQDIILAVDPIATNGKDPIPFSLTGKIDRYAPLAIKGILSPLPKQPGFSFATSLSGLEMPFLSPYSAAYIGNRIQSGKLSLSLDLRLKDRKLNGQNNIVAQNLYLGEEVPGEAVINAPVALGLALLRDPRGIIDLDIVITGDLDDPGFSISGIIIKALINVIAKAAAAPFKMLGSLVGGEESLDKIEFEKGLADLTSETETQLKHLADALIQRPQLVLSIQGNASEKDDVPVLKALQLLRQIAAIRGVDPSTLHHAADKNDWWVMPENYMALASLNDRLRLPSVLERIQQFQMENPDLEKETITIEVYRALYGDIISVQKIDAGVLLSLADRRALSIKQHLVDVLGLDHQRVSVKKAHEKDLNDRIVELKLETL